MTGTCSILNVGTGDTKLSFDKSNPAECIRSGRIVRDMLRRGYALLVEVERGGVKAFERAKDFDPETSEYIVADFDPVQAHEADMEEGAEKLIRYRQSAWPEKQEREEPRIHGESSASQENTSTVPGSETGEAPVEAKKRGRPSKGGRVPAGSTRAVGVARSAGG